jgi:hypothetical protein
MSEDVTHFEGTTLDFWQEIAEYEVDKAEKLFLKAAERGGNVPTTNNRTWSLILSVRKQSDSKLFVAHHDHPTTTLIETDRGLKERRVRRSKQFFLNPDFHTIFSQEVNLDEEQAVMCAMGERMHRLDGKNYDDDSLIQGLRAQSRALKRQRFDAIPQFAVADPMIQGADAKDLSTILESALRIQIREQNLRGDSAE